METIKKNNKKIIWLGFIISLFFFSIFVFTKDVSWSTNSVSPPSLSSTKIEKTNRAFLQINGEKLETSITEKENVYDFMIQLQKEKKISFKDKVYSGMGKFIEEINGVKNNGDKNWIYYVNDKKATIGVSNYQMIPGDIVIWKYEDSVN
ncbi:MAG: DUF4430 domain-containing protein [Candidatus Paceibacterota bacterium]|jgi:hypothetical protein